MQAMHMQLVRSNKGRSQSWELRQRVSSMYRGGKNATMMSLKSWRNADRRRTWWEEDWLGFLFEWSSYVRECEIGSISRKEQESFDTCTWAQPGGASGVKQVMTSLVPPKRQQRNRAEGGAKQCDRHSWPTSVDDLSLVWYSYPNQHHSSQHVEVYKI
jgi:hypothetical protein